MVRETSKSVVRRGFDKRYITRWLVGDGIDIGAGGDSIGDFAQFFPLMRSARAWDISDGDAMLMQGVDDETYDFVHSSHCLEHLVDPVRALENWIRVCRRGGHLVIMVPDEDLYEQGVFPSTHNPDHKWTFTIQKARSWCVNSISLTDLLRSFANEIQILKIELLDSGFIYGLDRRDQTLGPLAESAIEIVLRRSLTTSPRSVIPKRTPVNVAINAAALQSSFSRASSPNDPLGAITGIKTGRFGFHTEREDSPWWMLDLGRTHSVERIVIYNRCDGAAERARNLSIQICEGAGQSWQEVYRAENEFGGVADGRPLEIDFGRQPKAVRFVKIALIGTNFLHLDQIQIFGTDKAANYRNSISAAITTAVSSSSEAIVSPPHRSLGAIVVLTRGYKELAGYNSLIERNKAIYHCINRHRDTQYPLIIWHEGNITKDHQTYILSQEVNNDVRFVDVSEIFRLPAGIDQSSFEENWSVGYRIMGRFNTFDIWPLCSEFDYVLRIDEDCILEQIISDPFVWARDNAIDYGASVFVGEGLELVNGSFPYFVSAYLDVTKASLPPKDAYNQCFPYTNVGIARTDFFLRPDVFHFLQSAALEHDFYRFRWGDLSALGVALNIFSMSERMAKIPSLIYRHDSHRARIVGDDQLKIAREREKAEAAVIYSSSSPLMTSIQALTDAGRFEDAERLLLKAAADRPGHPAIYERICDVSLKLGRTEVVERLARTISR